MTKPELVFLGTSCGIPTVKRNLPSIAFRYGGSTLLLDCGEGTQRQMMRFRVKCFKVNSIFISHLHLDHFLGMFGLLDTMRLLDRKEGLNVIGPPGISDLLDNRYPYVHVKEIKRAGRVISFTNFSVEAFRNMHNAKDTFGFKIEFNDRIKFYGEKAKLLGIRGPMFKELSRKGKLRIGRRTVKLDDVSYKEKGLKIVYSGDTRPSENTVRHARGADVLIHDSTFLSEETDLAVERFHSTAREAATVAKKAGVKKLILTHISQRYTDANALVEEAKEIFKDTLCAYDGLRIIL